MPFMLEVCNCLLASLFIFYFIRFTVKILTRSLEKNLDFWVLLGVLKNKKTLT